MSDRAAAIAWRRVLHERVCDRTEPFELGTAVFTAAHPDYYDFNCLRIEEPQPDAAPAELAAWADRLQDGLPHRKVEVFDEATGARLQPGFEALGWHSETLLWMVHDGPPPVIPEAARPEPASDAEIRPLRLSWAEPPHTAEEVAAHIPDDEAVGALLGARNLALRRDGEPVAFTRYLLLGESAEVQGVFVTPERRGAGLGGALTAATAAQALADGAQRVFIVADADGRPRQLYARLGFRPVWTQHDFVRLPGR